MKKFGAMVGALVAGVVMAAGSALALDGYLMGDPAPGKLVPLYRATDELATLVGIENVLGDEGPDDGGRDVLVHVTIFNGASIEVLNFDLCLSPFDFGFVVLQDPSLNADQIAEQTGPRVNKIRFLTVADDFIPEQGYVSLSARLSFDTNTGTCGGSANSVGINEGIATWAILANVGSGAFATEIPTPTANVESGIIGSVSGGLGAYGLIPEGNRVIARFDVNPAVDSETEIFVWLANNSVSRRITGFLDCEDELEISTTLTLPLEVNVIDPDALAGIGQCKFFGQFRGVLRFVMPDTGFVWSQITQVSSSFRQNYLGYNLDENTFLGQSPVCEPGTIPPCE